MRLAQTQVWPMLRYFETIAPSTAASISASSNTTNGALPPRSRPSFFTPTAACRSDPGLNKPHDGPVAPEREPDFLHPARGLPIKNFSDFGRSGEADETHG